MTASSRELGADRDPELVQTVKCLLNLGHDWDSDGGVTKECEYCGVVIRDE